MQLTKNFALQEFASKDGAPTPHELLENIHKLATNLQVLRDHFQAPIRINSGYRSPSHNKKVGGAPKSQHVQGTAADIVVSGKTPDEVYEAIEQLIKAGKMHNGGLGRYNTFTHYDIRPEQGARWDYRK